MNLQRRERGGTFIEREIHTHTRREREKERNKENEINESDL